MNNRYKYLIIIVVVVLIAASVSYYFISSNSNNSQDKYSAANNNYSSYFYLNPISKNDVNAYKASCKQVSVEALSQNPDAYNKQRITETGQIVNITVNDDGVTEMLLVTPETNRDFTRLFVTYKGKLPYNIGDSITAYGEEDTLIVYQIKMPFLKSVYTEKN